MARSAWRSATPRRASPRAWRWPSPASSWHGGDAIGRGVDLGRRGPLRCDRRRDAVPRRLRGLGPDAQRLPARDTGRQPHRLRRARNVDRGVRSAPGRVPARHRVHGRLHHVLDLDGRERATRRDRRGRRAAQEPLGVDAVGVGARRGRLLPGAGDYVISPGLKLDLYFGESLNSGRQTANEAVMDCFVRHGLEVAALYRGIEGFGIGRRIHTDRFPDISTDLPLIAEAIDTREKIESVIPDVDAIVDRGLLTLEHSLLAVGGDARAAEFPHGVGSAGRLTVYGGRGERSAGRAGYRAVVELLRRQGARGATVLLGV